MTLSLRWPVPMARGWSQLLAWLMPKSAMPADFPFARSDVAMYHRTLAGAAADIEAAAPYIEVTATASAAAAEVDDATWRDLLLDDYSDRLAPQTSIFGRQLLHRRLRTGSADADSIARVRALAHDAPRLALLTRGCESLRHATSDVSALLFGAAHEASPRWAAHLRWLPVAFLASAVAAVVGWGLLWVGVVALWVALMLVQVRWHDSVQQWDGTLHTLQHMLRAHCLLAAIDDPAALPFRVDRIRAGKVNRATTRSSLEKVMPAAREYADWVWLQNVRHYFASRDVVLLHRDFLRASYLMLAELEADLALARHLAQTPRHCWAVVDGDGDGAGIALEAMVHPLLAGAAPLSFALAGKGAFISGQNGIGKSTLLRTVGLNVIVARAFGFCYADAARVALMPVYSSMQTEDSLASGESLYIAELRRARELLALAESGQPALFIIDEIFRGTNHLESISAAAAVLHQLAQSGRVIVSSHNLVLAPLLADVLVPLCVSAPDGDQSRLHIAPGVLAETNGIALLAARGFGPDIADRARRVHDWLSDYMAHPGDCDGLLNSR